MEKLQLYYHFPFCLSKCAYCAFYSLPCVSEEVIEAYVEALIRQTEGFAEDGFEVCTVYFGGGTPSVVGATRLARLITAIKRKFALSDNAEITVELNPKTINLNGMCLLKEAGANRLSIGAQSFNPETLRLLNRAHSAEDFLHCYDNALKAGFNNISADLIFALPHETTKMLEHSVKTLLSLKPQHISVYGLSVEEGTPLWAKKESLSFPDEEEEERQYELVCSMLNGAGYKHYEISNFALNGYQSRHNTGYWKRTPYFGFGAGAHSFYKNRRFYTEENLQAYINNSKLGYLSPTTFNTACEISDSEAEEERIMLGLRLSEGVELSKSVPKHLIDNGFVTYKDGKVCLTEKGFRVSNAIISQFI